MQPIKWNDKIVDFRFLSDGDQIIKQRKLFGKDNPICALCKSDIEGGIIFLVISNQAGIPNRYCHSKCVEGKTYNEVIEFIAGDYEMAKFHVEWLKNSGWWETWQ